MGLFTRVHGMMGGRTFVKNKQSKVWKTVKGSTYELEYRQNCGTNEIREYRFGSLTRVRVPYDEAHEALNAAQKAQEGRQGL